MCYEEGGAQRGIKPEAETLNPGALGAEQFWEVGLTRQSPDDERGAGSSEHP